MTTFRMLATIEFNRAIDKEKDYISPGGYEMAMKGETITFDFENYAGNIDNENPCLFHYEQRNPDYDTFEDLNLVTEEMLNSVEAIKEFFVYTGESEESDLKVVAIKELSFVLPYDDYKEIKVKPEVLQYARF